MDVEDKALLCNFRGCTNKADIIHMSRTFSNDNGSRWTVFINVCMEHFDDLVLPNKENMYIDTSES